MSPKIVHIPRMSTVLVVMVLILIFLAVIIHISGQAQERTRAQATATRMVEEATRAAYVATRSATENELLRIAEQQRSLIEDCRELYGSSSHQHDDPGIRNPVIPWLVGRNGEERSEIVFSILEDLPEHLRATPQDERGTVIIMERSDEVVGWYQPRGYSGFYPTPRPARRIVVDLCVTLWPEREILEVGRVTVEPPAETYAPGAVDASIWLWNWQEVTDWILVSSW
jgi:hypothetical protein